MNIIYLLGRGRSGSTLFSHLLGAQKGIINVGELKNYKAYHSREDWLNITCSDGVILKDHPFWKEVAKKLEKKVGTPYPDLRTKDFKEFKSNNKAIYDAIIEISGKDIIIDASKKLKHHNQLKKAFGAQVKTIYLVKDPRAYALSIYKSNVRKASRNKPVNNVLGKIIWWNIYNTALWVLRMLKLQKFLLLKYEDLAKNPELSVKNVLEYSEVNIKNVNMDLSSSKQPVLSGNVLFLEKGETKIEFDYSHLENLSNSQWVLFTLCAFPAIALYQYPIFKKEYLKN